LASEVQRRTGFKIELSTLLVERTIEQLANHILAFRDCGHSFASPSPENEKQILFCIPGIGGHSFNYRDLTPLLSQKHSIHLLHREIPESEQSSLTVEGQAPLYLNDIRRIQNHGPYHLCGYSFGGEVAYEVATRLIADGEDVGALIILDTINSA